MKKNYLKLVVPAVLLFPVVLFVASSLKSRDVINEQRLAMYQKYPMTRIFSARVDGVKVRQGKPAQQDVFLLQNMFNIPAEYKQFPLIQKRGNYLGTIPTSKKDVVPQADLVKSTGTVDYFYKFLYKGSGPYALVVAIPQMVLENETRMAGIQNYRDSKNWVGPNHFGYKGNFPFHFPLTIKREYYIGGRKMTESIPYRVYVSDENPNINAVFGR